MERVATVPKVGVAAFQGAALEVREGQALGLAPYDALIDGFTPGLRSAEIATVFRAYSRRLPALIREVIERQAARPPLPIAGHFAAGKQRAMIVEVMKAFGFPFDRGRLDESDHPFTEGVAGDIRVTTHFSTGIGSYVTFVLDVKFWMNAHAVAPQTITRVSKILLNPASRLASAPLFYIPSALGMGPALVAVARKPRLA